MSSTGIIEDVFVLDERNESQEIIITSKSGRLLMDNDNPMLVLEEGIVQNYDLKSQNLSTTHFQDLSYDLSSWSVNERLVKAKFLLTYSSFELFSDYKLVSIMSNTSPTKVLEELHSRTLTPFLALIAALIGFSTLMMGSYSRFGTSKQISLGIGALIFIKISESYANILMLKSEENWLAMYMPILIGFSIFSFLMFLASTQKVIRNKKQPSEIV
jgi:lipopolysaccharide export system permease protein